VRFVDGKETEKFSTLVYPQKKLPDEITRLTGINDNDLKDAPYAQEVLPEFLEFLQNEPLCAQNAPFDITFLKVEYARLGIPFYRGKYAEEIAFDTAVLSRALIPELESHGLSSLAEHLKIHGGVAHRAEDDARRCGLVLLKLIDILLELGASETSAAGRILGPGVMGDMFRGLAKYLSESGKGFDLQERSGYSNNLIGKVDTAQKLESLTRPLNLAFSYDGYISRNMGRYEPRPKQYEMAADCAEALSKKHFLMAEAGTGTGKSFAYLTPAVLFSIAEKSRVVVSTNTKNLQDQLFNKDLPFLEKSLPFKFQAALLKGRGNYLCRRKWNEVLSDPDYYLSDDERTRALTLLFWANRTTTGDIAENNGFHSGYLWSKFNSEAGSCSGSKCSQYNDCYLQNARKQASSSNIVIVNHALLLSDIASQNAVLDEYRYLVMDEAHNLEKAASNHLGKEANIHKLRAFCFNLYRKDGNETGLLARLKKKFESDNNLMELLEKATLETNRVRNNSAEFFGSITDSIKLDPTFKASQYTLKQRYGNGDTFINAGSNYFEELLKNLKDLSRLLRSISDSLTEKGKDVTDEGAPVLELNASADEASTIYSGLEDLYSADDPEWVFWWEMPQKENADVYLQSAPLNPGEMLNAKMYPWLDSIIFTSATLTVADDFSYFLDRLGLKLDDNREVIVKNYGSPFDYNAQALYCVPGFMPPPRNINEFNDSLADLIVKIAVEYRKGLLVLFTSYRQLDTVYKMISGQLRSEGIPLLGQGMDGGRTDILQKFLRERAVLLGTDSFWQGVDAPGEALEILIIAKLPFDVPTEPLVQARSEKLESEGKNPFLEYSIPEAVIKLRQGIGRLIRSGEDKGVVIICDNRVITTKWGMIFRESLPKKPEVLRSIHEVLGAVGEFI